MKYLKHSLIAAGVALLAMSAAVVSQVITVPLVSVIHPTDVIQVVPFGQPQANSQYALPAQITNTTGYYKSPASAPATGFTYTFANNQTQVAFTPSGTIASGYVILPPTPSDGAQACIFTTQTITQLNLCVSSTGTGNCVQTGLNAAISTLSANTKACYMFSASNSTWDRIQ